MAFNIRTRAKLKVWECIFGDIEIKHHVGYFSVATTRKTEFISFRGDSCSTQGIGMTEHEAVEMLWASLSCQDGYTSVLTDNVRSNYIWKGEQFVKYVPQNVHLSADILIEDKDKRSVMSST